MLNTVNEQELVSKWSSRIETATGVSDKRKLNWMSKMCHTQQVYEASSFASLGNTPGMGGTLFPGNPGTQYSFNGQAKGSGDKPFTLLPLAMQVAAQTIGLDLVPIVPMNGPMGILTYVDFLYAGGKMDSTDAPVLIKVPGLGSVLTAGSVVPSTTTVVKIYPNAGTIDVAATITGYYLGDSRLDGYAIFKVNTVLTNGTPSAIVNAITGTGGAGVKVTQGANTVSGFAVDKTAEFVKALEDHIPAFAGDLSLNALPMSRATGESTGYNTMGLTFFNKSVEAKTTQVAIAVTREQIQDAKQFGFDVIAQANGIIANELTQHLNKNIIDKIYELGATNHKNIEATEGVNFNLNLSGSSVNSAGQVLGNGQDGTSVQMATTLAAFSATTGENLSTMQRRILGRILAAANMISNRGRRGPADSVVTNAQIASALQDIAGYLPAPMSNTFNQSAGSLYPVGSVAGLNVYVDPNKSWADTRISVFRKGDGNTPGLVMMPYLMAESVETIAEQTMAPKIAAKTRYALVEAGQKPELYYITFKIFTPAGGIV